MFLPKYFGNLNTGEVIAIFTFGKWEVVGKEVFAQAIMQYIYFGLKHC
jgi:hypothetical protein